MDHVDTYSKAPYARKLVVSLSAVVSEECEISVAMVQMVMVEMVETVQLGGIHWC